MRILGLMSGSSLDGVDIAELEFGQAGTLDWHLKSCHSYEIPEGLTHRLRQALELKAPALAELQHDYTDFLVSCISRFTDEYRPLAKYISLHGHTLLHRREIAFSWQMVNAGYLSVKSGLHVLTDFRNQDMAAGGIGTPMAAIIDRDLFPEFNICINLGGIANITIKKNTSVEAYDLAPCNQVHNYYATLLGAVMDKDGFLCRDVLPDNSLVNKLMTSDYVLGSSPKYIDNAWIQKKWIKDIIGYDLDPAVCLRSHYEFLAQLIANVCQVETKVLVTGGGAKNSFFIELLKEKVHDAQVIVPDVNIIDFKECILMAYMAYKRIRKEKNFIPEATGAKNSSSAGALYFNINTDIH